MNTIPPSLLTETLNELAAGFAPGRLRPHRRAILSGHGRAPEAWGGPDPGPRGWRGQAATPGFTLIELLVVIAIIGILAAILLPVLARAKVSAQIQSAKMQMGQIVQAVNSYDSAYSRLPVSTNAMREASAKQEDFTYGTAGLVYQTTSPSQPYFNMRDVATGAAASILAVDATRTPFGYQTNNAEVMAILMDRDVFPGTTVPTINYGHVKNPQKTAFLNAQLVSDMKSPGVGTDLVYRDPWGNPYIISFDLNSDERTRDSFYRLTSVSHDPAGSAQTGFNGLSSPSVAPNMFEGNGSVMVWSAGPDRAVNSNLGAKLGANKDNVLYWKQ